MTHQQTSKIDELKKTERTIGGSHYFGRIAGVSIYEFEEPAFHMAYIGKAAVDSDGGPNIDNDPYWQPETSLTYNGKPINAQKVPYIVVPPKIRLGVDPVVMGCMAMACNLAKGLVTQAVVADQGPSEKIGEMSCECCRRIGLSGNSNSGGTDKHIILYILWPGIAAVVDGITYKLQPA